MTAALHNFNVSFGATVVFPTNAFTSDNIVLDYYATVVPSGRGSKSAATVSMTALGNFTLSRYSAIVTNGYGYAGASGPGSGKSTDASNIALGAGGGGYGGAGGDGRSNVGSGGGVYGDQTAPPNSAPAAAILERLGAARAAARFV